MSIEEIIRTWKADEEALEPGLPLNPVGRELDEHELLEVDGGEVAPICGPWTCFFTYCAFDTAYIW